MQSIDEFTSSLRLVFYLPPQIRPHFEIAFKTRMKARANFVSEYSTRNETYGKTSLN